MNRLDVTQTKAMLIYVADKIVESKPYLTEVDSKIGDGDHGIGMAGGLEKAKAKLLSKEFSSINEIFNTTGMTMLNSMGGASGVIFGTMFYAGVKGIPALEYLDVKSLAAIFETALKSIKERGKADVGDKTMVDAFQPAVMSLQGSANSETPLLKALELAEQSKRRC
jgi:dihydroxyacetone kinase-like protein